MTWIVVLGWAAMGRVERVGGGIDKFRSNKLGGALGGGPILRSKLGGAPMGGPKLGHASKSSRNLIRLHSIHLWCFPAPVTAIHMEQKCTNFLMLLVVVLWENGCLQALLVR